MIGKTLGHYQIAEKLGAGGMGVVYKARDLHLDRFVALKFLPPEKVVDPDRKRRFVQEAKAASALNHPNIIHVYDIDQSEGTDYIAMEGASAIDCWQPNRKSRSWYGLRLISKRLVQLSTGSRINEESQVPKQELSTFRKSWCREHHPLWFRYNQVGETASIPVSDLRKDVLLQHRHTLPPTPTSSRDL
jgi:serine/threonine protein kinase